MSTEAVTQKPKEKDRWKEYESKLEGVKKWMKAKYEVAAKNRSVELENIIANMNLLAGAEAMANRLKKAIREYLNLKLEFENWKKEHQTLIEQRDKMQHDHVMFREQTQVFELAIAKVHAEAPSQAMIFQQAIQNAYNDLKPTYYKIGKEAITQ